MKRIRSKSGRFIALIPQAQAGTSVGPIPTRAYGFSVVVTASGVASFIASWPCSRLHQYPIRFEYASNGDLVDIIGNQPDGEDLLALSQDAQDFGERMMAKLA